MSKSKPKFLLVDDYPITEYKCGACAGDQVRLRRDLVVLDHTGKPGNKAHRKGELWTVLSGSAVPPIVVWMRQPDGARHTWDDDSTFWDWFEKITN